MKSQKELEGLYANRGNSQEEPGANLGNFGMDSIKFNSHFQNLGGPDVAGGRIHERNPYSNKGNFYTIPKKLGASGHGRHDANPSALKNL
mmetsp:Transcript_5925/g.9681  ORF Transcript_5925/g.9681 Transcript_5925/m.9681 type:complete len:90 (+) Transcript_5925:464-733(+)